MQDYEGALGTYEAALDLFTKTNNLQGQGTCKNNMGETYCEMAAVRSACCVPTLIKSFDDRHAFFQQDTEDEAALKTQLQSVTESAPTAGRMRTASREKN